VLDYSLILLLAYCGLYCGDCAGYTGEIADAAKNLITCIKKYKFDRAAKHLFFEQLKEYDKVDEMLTFMAQLKCNKICRERKDDSTSCKIRKCCKEKGYYACYECEVFETCDTPASLSGLHGDSCVKNLKAIKEMGIEDWIERGVRLWFGSDVDDIKK
jgi:hypothetical protein